MTMMKPISIPPESTAFKKGVSMSEQLRRERIKVERSAIKEAGRDEPPKRGRPPKAKPEGMPIVKVKKPMGRPKKIRETFEPDHVTKLVSTILDMNFDPSQKLMFIDAIITKHKETR